VHGVDPFDQPGVEEGSGSRAALIGGRRARRRSRGLRREGLGDPPRRDSGSGGSSRRSPPPQGSEVVDLPASGRCRTTSSTGSPRGRWSNAPRRSSRNCSKTRIDSAPVSVEAHVSWSLSRSRCASPTTGAVCPRGGLELAVRRSYDEQDRLRGRPRADRAPSGSAASAPSIASVARVSVVTQGARTSEAGRSWLWSAERSSPSARRELPGGSTSPLSGLFENVPARRKFLKSERTEMSHLWECVPRRRDSPARGFSFRFTDSPGGRLRTSSRESALDARMRTRATTGNYLCTRRRLLPLLPDLRWGGLPQFARGGGRSLVLRQRPAVRDTRSLCGGPEAYRGILRVRPPPRPLPVRHLQPAGSRRQRPSGEIEVRYIPSVFPRSERTGASRPRRSARGGAVALCLPLPTPGRNGSRREGQGRGDSPRTCRSRVSPVPLPLPAAGMERAVELPFAERGTEAAVSAVLSSLVPVGQVLGMYLVCEEASGSSSFDPAAPAYERDRLLAPEGSVPREGEPDAIDAGPGGRRSPWSPAGGGRGSPGRGDGFSPGTGFSFPSGAGETIRLTGRPGGLAGISTRRRCGRTCANPCAPSGDLQRDLFRRRIADCGGWRAHTAGAAASG